MRKEEKGFRKIARILDFLLKIAIIICIIAVPIMIIGVLIINLASEDILKNITGSSITANIGSLRFVINNFNVDLSDFKRNVSFIIACGFVMNLLFIVIMVEIRKILENVLKDMPFSDNCIKHIRNLGYVVIIASIVNKVCEGIIEYLYSNLINLEKIMTSTGEISRVTNNISILNGGTLVIGLLILLLAGVFNYGKYLQEEYDTTI